MLLKITSITILLVFSYFSFAQDNTQCRANNPDTLELSQTFPTGINILSVLENEVFFYSDEKRSSYLQIYNNIAIQVLNPNQSLKARFHIETSSSTTISEWVTADETGFFCLELDSLDPPAETEIRFAVEFSGADAEIVAIKYIGMTREESEYSLVTSIVPTEGSAPPFNFFYLNNSLHTKLLVSNPYNPYFIFDGEPRFYYNCVDNENVTPLNKQRVALGFSYFKIDFEGLCQTGNLYLLMEAESNISNKRLNVFSRQP